VTAVPSLFIKVRMPYTPATKTLAAIAESVYKDQGAAYRVNLGKVIPHIGDAYRGVDKGNRSHLGASMLGRECGRALWYGFRWLHRAKFDGRMLRLFNRGHLEEARFIAILLTIGCQVFQQDQEGNQFRISLVGGHVGGSGDGVLLGVPDLPPGQPCLGEFKTHNDKSFTKLVKDGVRVAKPEHFVQMQMYMDRMGIPVGLYMAVNKNDDTIHAEIISLDPSVAATFAERGRTIVLSQTPPPKIKSSPGMFPCNFCEHRVFCHTGQGDVDKNCRTCAFSQAQEDGKWYCNNPHVKQDAEDKGWFDPIVLSKEDQRAGCEHYTRF
jgi:hypothetical protein